MKTKVVTPTDDIFTVGARTLPSRGNAVQAKSSASRFRDTSLQSNMKCDVNTRKNLYVDVVLSSGTNMFPEACVCVTNELTV